MSALRLDGLISGSRLPFRHYRHIEGPSYPLADHRLDMCLESRIVLCLCYHRFGYRDLALRIEPALGLPRMSLQLLNGAMAGTLGCSQQRANNLEPILGTAPKGRFGAGRAIPGAKAK
jgi:hypothetical protein